MPLIIVVDDRVTNRVIFSRLAASIAHGIVVKAFAEPLAVLDWIGENPPDLIITDYKMPGLEGAEFVRRLRQHPAGADVPIIVITAYEDREFRIRALEADATDFLQSPVDPQEFVTRSRNLLNLGQQRKLVRCRAENLQRELEVSEQSRATAIRESRDRLNQVIDTIPAAISAVDETGAQVFLNQYAADHLPPPASGEPQVLTAKDQQVLLSGAPLLAYEEEVTSPAGTRRVLLTSKFPLRDAGGTVRTVLTTSFDISDSKKAEQRLHHLAHHDALTQLPNRLMLQAVLSSELARSGVSGHGFALHFIDLDRFKSINDGFGHSYGDALLQVVAARLLQATRPGDTVARLGGDEFAVVQTGVASAGDATELAGRILRLVAAPVVIEQHQVHISASIGITVAPGDGNTAEQLLRNADLAMYRAKREGRSRLHFFSVEMQVMAREFVLLEMDLRQAVERNELVLHYQPQVNASDCRITGVEALLRWRRPGHGLAPPQAFLPLADDTGLIVPINRWVLEEACRQASAWSAAGMPVRMGVNLSSASFRTGSVSDMVVATLKATGLDPALLELELTESTVMGNQSEVADELHALRRLGVQVAIDDFGTGHSSLAYLQSLPIDRLKIDRSFIQDIETRANGRAVVDAVVGIGRSLNMDILAEGVETAGQFERVRIAGCQSVQGFYVSRPLTADQFQVFHAKAARLPVPHTV